MTMVAINVTKSSVVSAMINLLIILFTVRKSMVELNNKMNVAFGLSDTLVLNGQ